MSLDELQTICPDINAALFDVLTVEKSIKSRKSFDGKVLSEVLYQIAHWKKRLVNA
ncbi:hypothetical protein MF1_12540 [Bartonella quintana]|nr:hypothetical protein MF1_12540 [Bartonella quintana]